MKLANGKNENKNPLYLPFPLKIERISRKTGTNVLKTSLFNKVIGSLAYRSRGIALFGLSLLDSMVPCSLSLHFRFYLLTRCPIIDLNDSFLCGPGSVRVFLSFPPLFLFVSLFLFSLYFFLVFSFISLVFVYPSTWMDV